MVFNKIVIETIQALGAINHEESIAEMVRNLTTEHPSERVAHVTRQRAS
jgi:hypothetical protein